MNLEEITQQVYDTLSKKCENDLVLKFNNSCAKFYINNKKTELFCFSYGTMPTTEICIVLLPITQKEKLLSCANKFTPYQLSFREENNIFYVRYSSDITKKEPQYTKKSFNKVNDFLEFICNILINRIKLIPNP